MRIDSVHGRLRAIVQNAPDAPVSRAIVDMQGAQKGLLVNSTDLCAATHRARVNAAAQSGARATLRPVVHASCPHKRKHKRHRQP